jgi:hypothetical protein
VSTSDGDNATHFQIYPAVAQPPAATLSNLANNNRIGFLIVTAYVRAGSVQIDTNLSVSATGQVSYAQVSNKLFVAGTSLTSGIYNTNGATNTGALLCAGPALLASLTATNGATNFGPWVSMPANYSGSTNRAFVGPVTNQWSLSASDWFRMTNDTGLKTNLTIQLTNVAVGVRQWTVIYGNKSANPSNEFFSVALAWPGGGAISWLAGLPTNGTYDFLVRSNRAVLVELFCDRATNVFARYSTNNILW